MTPDGAVDHDYDDAEKPPAERMAADFEAAVGDVPTHKDLSAGDLAFDLVTRQTLLVVDRAAESCVEYFDESPDDFNLAAYKGHPWLPVRSSDPVFTCVFLPSNVEGLHNAGKEYAYPAGRLARVPTELLGGDE